MREEPAVSPDDSQLPDHEFVDHPSELVLHVRARTFAELAREATLALASVMETGMEYTGKSHQSEFVVDGTDRGAILVNLLNEVITLAESEHFIPTNVEAALTSSSHLGVSVKGRSVAEAPSLVKAATFHDLDVRERNGVVSATVTFDI